MSHELTKDELAIYDQVGRLTDSLWDASKKVSGRFTDPKMMSVMLYKRLRTNYLGFTVLWQQPLALEAAIVLRSGLETSICIAANRRLGDAFATMMRADAAATLTGQIKLHRAEGATELVQDGEANLRDLLAGLPEGSKAARLDWKSLADAGEVPSLYNWHRMLSGLSSHVTGLSIMNGVTDDTEAVEASQAKLRGLNSKMHPMMMAGAGLTGSMHHAEILGDDNHHHIAVELSKWMAEISKTWTWGEGR